MEPVQLFFDQDCVTETYCYKVGKTYWVNPRLAKEFVDGGKARPVDDIPEAPSDEPIDIVVTPNVVVNVETDE